MTRFVLLAVLSLVSLPSLAECEKIDAVFENERASSVLSILATEAGLTLVNPELATGRVNATFEGEDAGKLLPVIAWDLGYEIRLQGRKAWLHPADGHASQTRATDRAGS